LFHRQGGYCHAITDTVEPVIEFVGALDQKHVLTVVERLQQVDTTNSPCRG
jgi:xanthine dehydrogenase iron-sulfur cluster and FAD-binding subunit A